MFQLSPNVLDHIIGTAIILGLAAVLLTVFLLAACWLGGRLAQADRQRHIETVFMQVWDGSRTNELQTWYMVQDRLIRQGAKPQVIRAVEARIETCRQRQDTACRLVHLPGKDGRPMIISTEN